MKHLNPRQGITTPFLILRPNILNTVPGVKHLNPRQGITTDIYIKRASQRAKPDKCETPKSPPGDYNADRSMRLLGT